MAPMRGSLRSRRSLPSTAALLFAGVLPITAQEASEDAIRTATAAGDEAFERGDFDDARTHYRAALDAFEDLAAEASTDQPEDELTAIEQAYTYRQLYRSEYGRLRQRLVSIPFLTGKLSACEPSTGDAEVTYRIAVFVVLDTDLDYHVDGEKRHERAHLDDAELSRYRFAWGVAARAADHWAGTRVRFESRWIELEGVTLRGLTERAWNGGLLNQRHLDPARLDPLPDETFARIVPEVDCVAFVWPRGEAASTYGGGPIELPGPAGPLAVRGGIRSLSPYPSVCLHELLHNVESRAAIPRVHGPPTDAQRVFARHDIRDELDWYAHLLRSVPDWEQARFRPAD